MTRTTYQSFAEFYRNSDYAQFSHEHRTGGSFPVHFTRAKQTAIDFVDPPIPELLLVIGLRSDIPFRWDIGDGWTKERRFRTQDIVFCPSDTEIRHDCGGDHEILFCYFPAKRVASLLDEEMGADLSVFNPLHGPVFRDETIRSVALKMWTESVGNDQLSHLMIDGLLQTLIAQMLRRAKAKTPLSAERFGDRVMSRLDDYIDARSGDGLSVVDLAQVADRSPFYFARSFKRTTGQSPHQYVMARRVDRAREMLTAGKLSLVEVALECGFCDQAHFTRVFRKHLGVTPGQYQKETRR